MDQRKLRRARSSPHILLTVPVLCLFATLSASAQQVGSTVDFDRITSTNPTLGAWDRGVVISVTTIAGQPTLKIRNRSGTTYSIPNDPRWIHAVDPSSTGPEPDGTRTGPYPNSTARPVTAPTAGPQTPPTTNRVPSPAARFAPGTRVEFDRVEGSKPEYSRWDNGTVIGRDPWGRVQIRGDNGITYSIQDDPRWIVLAGTPHPGRRHDYLNTPTPVTPRPGTTGATPPAAGSTGPLEGEWAVIAMDGKPTGGHGMTFNFVGARYELVFQGDAQSGSYSVSGNTVRMIAEDGALFGTFQYSIQGDRLQLKAPGTEFVLRRGNR